jgi:hypothetical protein
VTEGVDEDRDLTMWSDFGAPDHRSAEASTDVASVSTSATVR